MIMLFYVILCTSSMKVDNSNSELITIIVAILGLVLSIIALYISKRTARTSIKPLVAMTILVKKNLVVIKLKNFGLGTAIINDTFFLDMNTNKNLKRSLHELILFDKKDLENAHKFNFYKEQKYYLEPNGEKTIFSIKGEKYKGRFDEVKKLLLSQISNIYYKVDYTDVYNKKKGLEPCIGCVRKKTELPIAEIRKLFVKVHHNDKE